MIIALAASMAAAEARAASHHHERPVFRPPVDAPVADPFRPPENPYGPGNRGVEYDTEPGDVVRAAASGTVVFAGAVAGTLHVTVDHNGGLVSSYSHLQRISVRAGNRVARGAVIGIAGESLHFGVRLDGAYTDPDSFVGVRRVRVRLVPRQRSSEWVREPAAYGRGRGPGGPQVAANKSGNADAAPRAGIAVAVWLPSSYTVALAP